MALAIDRPRSGSDARGALGRLVKVFDSLGETGELQGAREALRRSATELNNSWAGTDTRTVEAEQAALLAHGETTLEAASLAVAAAKVNADPAIRAGLLKGARAVLALEAWHDVTADADALVKVLRGHHDRAVKALVGADAQLPASGWEPEVRDHRGRQAWSGMLAAWETLALARAGWVLLVETGALPVPGPLVKAADDPSELLWTAESTLTGGFAAPGPHPGDPHPARLAAARMAAGSAVAWLPNTAELRKGEAAMVDALNLAKSPLPHPFARGAMTA